MKLILFLFTLISLGYASPLFGNILDSQALEQGIEKIDSRYTEAINENLDYKRKILFYLAQKTNDKQQKVADVKKDSHLLIIKIKNLQKDLLKRDYMLLLLLLLFVSLIIFAVKIVKENKLYKDLAQIDVLSGLFNRRFMINRMEEEICKYKRDKTPFSILLIDIDYFKEVNDKYGHHKGDLVIKKISTLMKEHTRNTDICARWGGEEFIILATNTDLEGALQLACNFREVVEKHDFEIQTALTISTGISSYLANQEQECVLKVADERLYKAKEKGRNRVEFT